MYVCARIENNLVEEPENSQEKPLSSSWLVEASVP
jgi:hypothetical protein